MTRVLVAAACVAMGTACGGQAIPGDASTPGSDGSANADAGLDAPADTRPDVTIDATPVDGSGDIDAAAPPPPEAESDAAGLCSVVCSSSADCENGCPPAFLTLYCCDVTTGTCFVGQDGIQHCPLHDNGDASVLGCLPTGCPAGQMCVTYNTIDPPTIPVPSCFALPAACANDPTCTCLADAGVCGPDGGGYVPSCDGLDGAVLNCNAY